MSKLKAYLEAGRALEEKATPGPWERVGPMGNQLNPCMFAIHDGAKVVAQTSGPLDMRIPRDPEWEEQQATNAKLIADSRTRVQRYRAIIEVLVEALSEIASGCDCGETLTHEDCLIDHAKDILAQADKLAGGV